MRDAIRGHQRHSEPVQSGPERTHVDDRTHSRLALYEEQPRRLVGRSGGLSASVQLEAGPECPTQCGEPRTHLMRMQSEVIKSARRSAASRERTARSAAASLKNGQNDECPPIATP